MSEMVVGSHLGHNYYKVSKFKSFVDRKKSASKSSTLDMRRTDFRLTRELVSKVPGKMFLEVLGFNSVYFLNITS